MLKDEPSHIAKQNFHLGYQFGLTKAIEIAACYASLLRKDGKSFLADDLDSAQDMEESARIADYIVEKIVKELQKDGHEK